MSSPSASSDLLSTARPKSPYPGLRPFEIDEWSIFFGREQMVDEVIDRLAAHHLVMIHGSSGSGKSSLVRAGVLPKLARQHMRAGTPWQTCTMRPSGGPLWNLAKEFARLDGHIDDVERTGQIMAQFNRTGATLSSIAGSLDSLKGKRLCILVDQFEELFRFEKETSREEAELFVDLLVNSNVRVSDSIAADQVAPVHIAVTMRSEFLGECARFSGLAEAVNRTQYLVPRMDRESLVRAIRRPALLYRGTVSLDLTEELIADASGREDELPLIQHGLMYLWNNTAAKNPSGSKIVLEPGPLQEAGGLANLLSSHADAIVDEAAPKPEDRFAVERMFRALTDLNAEGYAIRRPKLFRELVALTEIGAEKLRDIIDALRRDGVSFLTPYARQPITENTTIDISHEALIRCWRRLANLQDGWLRREFDDGLIWRSLVVEAQGFKQSKQRILSPATTEERWSWWQQRKLNSTWAERYGGNFALTRALIDASHKSARRRRLSRAALIVVLLITSCSGVAYAAATNRVRLQMLADLYVRRMVLSPDREKALKPAEEFQDCTQCPQMVMVPAGHLTMGSPTTDASADSDEFPQHEVTFATPLAVSKFEVTFADWDTCYDLGGCRIRPDDFGWGRGNRPVVNVDWYDAQQYVAWLSKQTGKTYRLLTEAEWEYAARAGTATAYSWGDEVKPGGKTMANCFDCGSPFDDKETAPVGSFPPNAFGLNDMLGNAWEWVEDCYHDSYEQAPADGSAWSNPDCRERVSRGGSWGDLPQVLLRTAFRLRTPSVNRYGGLGFRVARVLEY
ncbi:MAG TPA: formylglycine-generating enzyme family protein [Xanthobacteraceae bacterium]|nr:formylglycine-generating enzyme family protein [Xanthobacteraceae bacterium]